MDSQTVWASLPVRFGLNKYFKSGTQQTADIWN